MTEKLFKQGHSSDIQGRKRRGVHPTLYEPRPSKSRKLDLEYLSWKIEKIIYTKSKSCCSISENDPWRG